MSQRQSRPTHGGYPTREPFRRHSVARDLSPAANPDNEGVDDHYDIYERFTSLAKVALESAYAKLMHASACVVLNSGMSAITSTIESLVFRDDEAGIVRNHVVVSPFMFSLTLKHLGIQKRKGVLDFTVVTDPDNPQSWADAIGDRTILVLGETFSNPGGKMLDIRALSAICRAAGVLLGVDNTFGLSEDFHPLDEGADLELDSGTKGAAGGAAMNGVVGQGKGTVFPPERYPAYNRDGEYAEEATGDSYASLPAGHILKLQAEAVRVGGSGITADRAQVVLNMLESFPRRSRQMINNAKMLAELLESHPMVEKVFYPGLKSSPYYETYMNLTGGQGALGLVTFRIRGGAVAAEEFMKGFGGKIAYNLYEDTSIAAYPIKMTNAFMTPEQLVAADVTDADIRFSPGTMHWDLLLRQLERGFACAEAALVIEGQGLEL